MLVWIVGKLILNEGVQIGWMPEGIYLTESEAALSAQEGEWIACVKMGERMPSEACDAIKFYYPKSETWEQSKLYKLRSESSNG